MRGLKRTGVWLRGSNIVASGPLRCNFNNVVRARLAECARQAVVCSRGLAISVEFGERCAASLSTFMHSSNRPFVPHWRVGDRGLV